MFLMLHDPRASALMLNRIARLLVLLFTIAVHVSAQTADQSTGQAILNLIYRQQYNEAISRLEEILERDPKNSQALTYMATANLYQTRDYLKAKQQFEEAFNAGGGATFFVNHSHEMFSTAAVVDYCRGWLHLRRDGIEFVPTEGTDGFKIQYSQVQEFKGNRLSKKIFHIKFDGKSRNFRGRTNTDFEPLLIIALYKSFTQN